MIRGDPDQNPVSRGYKAGPGSKGLARDPTGRRVEGIQRLAFSKPKRAGRSSCIDVHGVQA